jgi:hypothetical protein
MNVYGKTMTNSNRRAHGEVADRILNGGEVVQELEAIDIREFVGVVGALRSVRNLLKRLVSGEGGPPDPHDR